MKSILQLIDVNIYHQNRDNDVVWGIIGEEGSGKSNLMMHVKDYYCNKMNIPLEIKDIGLNVQDFKVALTRNKDRPFANPVFDEAQDGLYSREAMKGNLNILLNKTYMAIRGMRFFTILCLPDFFSLDTYFRKKRIRGLFWVYKRGHCAFYTKDQVSFISMQKSFKGVKPIIRDTFPKYKGKLKKEYDALKKERMSAQIKRLETEGMSGITNKELAQELIRRGVGVPQICKIIKNEQGKPIANSYIYTLRKELKEEGLLT